ncbi:MAG TPA: hypothetical protein VFM05_09285, partial [Candidatus Saccharimonadales bacterium]|nr:hypothetical protein [Candidatus Saccharimonadales bacterium]
MYIPQGIAGYEIENDAKDEKSSGVVYGFSEGKVMISEIAKPETVSKAGKVKAKTNDKRLWIAKVLTQGVGTPYMLTDLDIIRRQCLTFRATFPTVQLYYAMKAFSDDEVILTVDPLVDGYDAASINEVDSLLKLGISPSRIAYSNPVKSDISISSAAEKGIDKFAFQSQQELDKIAAHAPGSSV